MGDGWRRQEGVLQITLSLTFLRRQFILNATTDLVRHIWNWKPCMRTESLRLCVFFIWLVADVLTDYLIMMVLRTSITNIINIHFNTYTGRMCWHLYPFNHVTTFGNSQEKIFDCRYKMIMSCDRFCMKRIFFLWRFFFNLADVHGRRWFKTYQQVTHAYSFIASSIKIPTNQCVKCRINKFI